MPSSDTGRGGGLTNHPGGILGAVTTQKTANKRLGSIGWFKGRITGNSHGLHGEIVTFPIQNAAGPVEIVDFLGQFKIVI